MMGGSRDDHDAIMRRRCDRAETRARSGDDGIDVISNDRDAIRR
jgi:hypothetical protein